MNRRLVHPATCFLLLSVGVILLSWVGTIYRWEGVNSMLGLENLRWLLRNFVQEFFNQSLLPYIFFLLFSAGLWVHSGLADAFRRLFSRRLRLSRKERLSLWLVGGVTTGYILLLLFIVFGPYNLLRSVVGTVYDSPFSQGLVLLIGFILSLVSIVYGVTTDNYQRDCDVYVGMGYYFNRLGEFFVILFFISVFFMLFQRSGFASILHLSKAGVEVLSSICSLLSLFYCVHMNHISTSNES